MSDIAQAREHVAEACQAQADASNGAMTWMARDEVSAGEWDDRIEITAALAAIHAERERCAKVADEHGHVRTGLFIGKAIRKEPT